MPVESMAVPDLPRVGEIRHGAGVRPTQPNPVPGDVEPVRVAQHAFDLAYCQLLPLADGMTAGPTFRYVAPADRSMP